jgi:signal transduction histidine kinase
MPIDEMTRTARRISAEDLHARLALPATDDEVGRLAATFDEMIARLEASFQRERRFTTDASHELRTPLAAMLVILGVTRSERRTPEEYEQALDDLTDETNRLRGLTETLLRLARGTDTCTSSSEQIDLAFLVADVAEVMRPLAEAKGLSLTCTLPPTLNVIGDNDALIRLFVNLIENAIKYSEHGSITVCGALTPGSLQVQVTDSGTGIAAEHLPHVFERFYRADAARTTSGAGLGLALAYEIVHAHGGTIAVQSQVGSGSTFTVTLPRASIQALHSLPIS